MSSSTDQANRITAVGDQFREHMGTLSSVLLGFSLFGFQVENREGDGFLVGAMVCFALAVMIATLHGYEMTKWLDELRNLTGAERTSFLNRSISKKKRRNKGALTVTLLGLALLVTFAISNAKLW